MKSSKQQIQAWGGFVSYSSARAQLTKTLVRQAGLDEWHAAEFYGRLRMADEVGYIFSAAVDEVLPLVLEDKAHPYTIVGVWHMTDWQKLWNIACYVKDNNYTFSNTLLERVREWAATKKPSTIAKWRQVESDYKVWLEERQEHYRQAFEEQQRLKNKAA